MKLKKFWLLSGAEWFKVQGLVNPKGWLEWKDSKGASGLSQPRHHGTKWTEREGNKPPATPQRENVVHI